MPSTPLLGLRYPQGTDPANVPLYMQQLAEDVEAKLGGSARGLLGRWENYSDSGAAGGTPAVIAGSNVTFTAETGRLYRLALGTNALHTGASGLCRLFVYLDGTQKLGILNSVPASTYGYFSGMWAGTLAAGPHTATVWLSADAGTVNTFGTSGFPSMMTVEDIGKA